MQCRGGNIISTGEGVWYSGVTLSVLVRLSNTDELFTVCKQTKKWENFCPDEKNCHWYLKEHLNSRTFYFLPGMSIFTCFGAMSLKSLCFSVDFVCWLAKYANHNIKTLEKQKI